jgi:hypothetical protein
VDDPHPAQPGRGDEAGHVGDGSPTERDDHVGARESAFAELSRALSKLPISCRISRLWETD